MVEMLKNGKELTVEREGNGEGNGVVLRENGMGDGKQGKGDGVDW